MTSLIIEVFSALGLPARIVGRFPLLSRYALNPQSPSNAYSRKRYINFSCRPWLWSDTLELEATEELINYGTNAEIEAFLKSRLDIATTTSIVVSLPVGMRRHPGSKVSRQGGLLVTASSAILALNSLTEIHYVPRGLFTMSLLLALLSVYFTLLQQREFVAMSAETFIIWLWDGRKSPSGQRRSSLSANIILQAPFELLAISISLFLGALGTYLGLAYTSKIDLSKGWDSNSGVFISFVAVTGFALFIFGLALGLKDKEMTSHESMEERERLKLKRIRQKGGRA